MNRHLRCAPKKGIRVLEKRPCFWVVFVGSYLFLAAAAAASKVDRSPSSGGIFTTVRRIPAVSTPTAKQVNCGHGVLFLLRLTRGGLGVSPRPAVPYRLQLARRYLALRASLVPASDSVSTQTSSAHATDNCVDPSGSNPAWRSQRRRGG